MYCTCRNGNAYILEELLGTFAKRPALWRLSEKAPATVFLRDSIAITLRISESWHLSLTQGLIPHLRDWCIKLGTSFGA